MRDGGVAVVPAGEPLLDPYLRDALDGRHVRAGRRRRLRRRSGATAWCAPARTGSRSSCRSHSRHNLRNALAAVAAARAVGRAAGGPRRRRASARCAGERVALAGGATVVNDCYNANPLSMRAALDDLAMQDPAGRRVAVLGDMLELGPDERAHHREIGAYAAARGRRPADRGRARGRPAMLGTRSPAARRTRCAGRGRGRRARRASWCGRATSCSSRRSRGVGLEVVAEALAAAATP